MSEDLFNEFKINACSIRPHVAHLGDTKDAHDIVWWTNVIFLPAIALIGLACNLLNLLILTHNKSARRIPSWHLLVALALCDSIFLVFATLEVTPTSVRSLVTSTAFNAFYTHIVLVIRTLASTFYKASVLIVVAFNVERYICVCHPLRAHRIWTPRRSRLAICASLMISFLCSVQWPLVYRVKECWDNIMHHSYYVIVISDSEVMQAYYKFMDYLSLFGFNVMPIVILFILNIRLIITLRRVVDQDLSRNTNGAIYLNTVQGNGGVMVVANLYNFCKDTKMPRPLYTSEKWRFSFSKHEKIYIPFVFLIFLYNIIIDSGKPKYHLVVLILPYPTVCRSLLDPDSDSHRLSANAMLFAVVAMLFVCVGPQAPARLLYEIYGQYHQTAVVYTCVTQLLVFLNASLNFCLYCLVSKRYRGLLKESIRQVFSRESECCTSTGIQLRTKFTSLPSPSSTEEHPMLDRRNSAMP